jgi:hypothetical protein
MNLNTQKLNKMKKIKSIVVFLLLLFSCTEKNNDILPKENKNLSFQKTTEDPVVIVYDSLIVKDFESISKFYVKNSENIDVIDSVVNIYYKLISRDSLFEPAYISLITIFQKEGHYSNALDLIDIYLQRNVKDNNYSFLYQKSLTLMCIDGKKQEGEKIMLELWKKMKNDTNLNEQESTLYLILSKVLGKNVELIKIKERLITVFKVDLLLINSMLNSSELEHLLPCRRQ